MNVKINRLQHIGIPVTDLAVSEAFYERLGFQRIMAAAFNHNGEKGQVQMMQLNDIIVELYQLPEKERQEIKTRKNGHIDHIAFDVDDIEHTFQVLKEGDFHILEEQPVFLSFWSNGCKYFNILGPDGERLEFNQILGKIS